MIRLLSKQPRLFILALGYVLLALLGIVEYVAPAEVLFLGFYLVPIFLVTWFVGARAGVLMAFFCALVSTIDGKSFSTVVLGSVAFYWNVLSEFIVFTLPVLMLNALRGTYNYERGQVHTDFITGAANVRAFREFADSEIRRARRYPKPLTLVYCDLDDFTMFNEQRGISAGDELLRLVATALKGSLRTLDVVARIREDEFAALLPETDSTRARLFLPRVQEQIAEMIKEKGYAITFSLGAVTFMHPPESVDTMLRVGEGVMCQAKQAGQNEIHYRVIESATVLAAESR